MERSEIEKSLKIVSRAWGRTQQGFAFFPWIDRGEQERLGTRRAGFHEGQAFSWPEDRLKIIQHIKAHENHDLYWCPSLFEYPERKENFAMDEHALWADLDEVDPYQIADYQPTVAWETSPGRYQALWVAASGDFQGASWPGNENQRLTYLTGADPSGWDTVQLLRLPNWPNYKLDRRGEKGDPTPQGKLLWADGPTYHPGDFRDLPEVRGAVSSDLSEAIESDIDGIDRHKVIARIQLKLTKRARDMISAREVSGDLSSQLWYLHRALADVNCSIAEIVAITRETVWNKFRDRADEMRVLISEASKAIANRKDDSHAGDNDKSDGRPISTQIMYEDDDAPRPMPMRFGQLLANVKKPKFIIEGLLTEGACGFIAGEPKSFKSWTGLDLAISVATGAPFLNHFRVNEPGPVLYIQEEDPLPTLKSRTAKVWQNKSIDEMVLVEEDGMPAVMWFPPESGKDFNPDIDAYVQHGFTISDPEWMLWLDEVLAGGMKSYRGGLDGEVLAYRVLIIDTLMMTAGEVEENKSQDMMNKIFRPLKVISRKYNMAVLLVHHMGKADNKRAGQRMLGSVANHAWSEDALYLSRAGLNDIKLELESKTAAGGSYRIKGLVGSSSWQPEVYPWSKEDGDDELGQSSTTRRSGNRSGSTTNADELTDAGDVVIQPRKARAAFIPQTAQGDVLSFLNSNPQGLKMREILKQVVGFAGISDVSKTLSKLEAAGKVMPMAQEDGSVLWRRKWQTEFTPVKMKQKERIMDLVKGQREVTANDAAKMLGHKDTKTSFLLLMSLVEEGRASYDKSTARGQTSTWREA